jgi:Leucine-rich repeat (LRR) protein
MATKWNSMNVVFSYFIIIIPTVFFRGIDGQNVPIVNQKRQQEQQRSPTKRRLRFITFPSSPISDAVPVEHLRHNYVSSKVDTFDIFDNIEVGNDIRGIFLSMPPPTDVPTEGGSSPDPPSAVQSPTPSPTNGDDGAVEEPTAIEPIPPGILDPTESPETSPLPAPTATPVTTTPRPTTGIPSNPPSFPPITSPPTKSNSPTTVSPTNAPPPAEPPTRDDNRDALIEAKCGVTALERSRDILAELLTVSSSSSLVNPETPQFQGREWIDNIDPAIICPNHSPQRIHQRYRLSLLYYQMGGDDWIQCSAIHNNNDNSNVDNDGSNESTTIVDPASVVPTCQGIPFLDERNECEWYGMSCGTDYDQADGDEQKEEEEDLYYPLQELVLPSNNLVGTLFDELYGLDGIQRLNLQGNKQIGGTISDKISELSQLRELDLGGNTLSGSIPDSLYELPELTALYLNDNILTGSISNDIGQLRNVTMVQFQYNSLSGQLPEEGLFALERLGEYTYICRDTVVSNCPLLLCCLI